MRCTFILTSLGMALAVPLLSSPTPAQTARTVRKEPSRTAADVISVRGCPRPAEVRDARVFAFDKGSLETKLVVSLGKGEFKVVTIRLWDRPDDPRPLIPVIEAAWITQGKLQFYTPDFNTDPASVSDRFILIAEMGGPQICWASPSSLLGEGGYPIARDPKGEDTPAPVAPTATESTGSIQAPRTRTR